MKLTGLVDALTEITSGQPLNQGGTAQNNQAGTGNNKMSLGSFFKLLIDKVKKQEGELDTVKKDMVKNPLTIQGGQGGNKTKLSSGVNSLLIEYKYA